MSTKIIIIGNTEHAKTMYNYIKVTDFGEVIAFAVNRPYVGDGIYMGEKVVAIEDLTDLYDPKDVSLIMGIGYMKMGNIKEKLYLTCKEMGFNFINYIHPTAIISGDVILGDANNILEGVILESGVILGNGNLLFGGSIVAHDTSIGNYNTLSVKACVAGCSNVEDHCMIGANSTVRDHLTVHSYALIGAGAYAKRDLDEYAVLTPPESLLLEGKKSTDFL